jgi:hypothetical protein
VTKPGADWDSIEREYRAGSLSIEEIARRNGITSAAIRKKAKRLGWTRTLKSKIDDAVKGYLIPYVGSGTGSGQDPEEQARAEAAQAADGDFVDYAARRTAEVVLTHRRRIDRAHALTERMFQELEEQTTGRDVFSRLIEVAFAGGDEALMLMRELLKQHLALGSRAKTLTNLANVLTSLTNLERRAYGLSDDPMKGVADPVQIEQQRAAEVTGKTDEELARLVLGLIERASRAKAAAAPGGTKH